MNLTTVHYVQMICGGLGAGLPALAMAYPEPTRPYFLAVGATLALLGTVLGVVSKSGVKPDGDA